MKVETGDQKEIALIALTRAGRPSHPCLGAAKQSLGFMWKTTGRNNHFQGKTRHYDLEVDVFSMSSWARSTLSLREIRFQMIIDICWVFVVWVSLTFETTLYLCSGAKDHSVCVSVGSVKRWHSGLCPYNIGVRFSHQLTSVSLSDVLSFFSFTIFSSTLHFTVISKASFRSVMDVFSLSGESAIKHVAW